MSMTIGQRKLIKWRDDNGFSLREAAAFLTEKVNDHFGDRIYIPHATVQRWENGAVPRTSRVLQVVNHVIMASYDDWVTYE